jgi:alanine racemase
MLSNRFTSVRGRVFGFERIIKALKIQWKLYLKDQIGSVQNNLNFYRKKNSSLHKLMAMVKLTLTVAEAPRAALFCNIIRVDYLAVMYTDEGVSLRKNGIELPIMVLNCAGVISKRCQLRIEPRFIRLNLGLGVNSLVNLVALRK